MEPNEFTISAEAHAQLAAISGDLSNALADLEYALGHMFHVLGEAAVASLNPDERAALAADIAAQKLADQQLDDAAAAWGEGEVVGQAEQLALWDDDGGAVL